jgi:hypothetical protein
MFAAMIGFGPLMSVHVHRNIDFTEARALA